jgi:hypothetical protein
MDADKSTTTSDTTLLRYFTDTLELSAEDIDNISEQIKTNPEEATKYLSLSFFQMLDAEKDELLSENYDSLKKFRDRLFQTWQAPLKRLDTLLYMCTEIVDELRQEHPSKEIAITNKFNIATRLHARCIQVGNEISHLLHGGYADGAFARWRTLHETSVTAIFICEGDEDLASRFTNYQHASRISAATRFNKNNELGFEAFTTEQLAQMAEEQKNIVEQYEPCFKNKFGWALKALGKAMHPKSEANFIDVEKFVELSFLRNHFSFANQYVHAGIDSIGFKLGTSMSKEDLLLVGPSNEGLIEPIQCTSLSLVYATIALITAYPSEESDIRISVFRLWHEVLKQEVLNADAALQARGDALRPPKC